MGCPRLLWTAPGPDQEPWDIYRYYGSLSEGTLINDRIYGHTWNAIVSAPIDDPINLTVERDDVYPGYITGDNEGVIYQAGELTDAPDTHYIRRLDGTVLGTLGFGPSNQDGDGWIRGGGGAAITYHPTNDRIYMVTGWTRSGDAPQSRMLELDKSTGVFSEVFRYPGVAPHPLRLCVPTRDGGLWLYGPGLVSWRRYDISDWSFQDYPETRLRDNSPAYPHPRRADTVVYDDRGSPSWSGLSSISTSGVLDLEVDADCPRIIQDGTVWRPDLGKAVTVAWPEFGDQQVWLLHPEEAAVGGFRVGRLGFAPSP